VNHYELLFELSYFDLEGRTKNIMGPERDNKANRVQLQNFTYIPMMNNNALKIASNTTSNNGHDYWTTLLFSNIEYLDAAQPDSFSFKGSDNAEYFIKRVQPSTNVKVNCSCLDFHYRFSVWDDKFKALDGQPPPPYIRKTQNRPEVNPMKTPGLCKHIIKIMNDLKAQHFFS